MESYKIIAGLSDIKTELWMRTGSVGELSEFQLWFSYSDQILYVHDFKNHERCLALAIVDNQNKTFKVFFRSKGFGRKVLEHFLGDLGTEAPHVKFNKLNLLSGFSILQR